MARSFQHEKPPARINLFLEVQTGGALVKKELPLRMLMLGDYTGREDGTPLEDREVINVNKDNFDAVLKSLDVKAEYTVPDRIKGGDEEMKVNLSFEDMKSFRPDQVARQVPVLTRLMAMRNLLQDLRNRVVSMNQFRKELEKIVQDKEAMLKLSEQLDRFVAKEPGEAGAAG